jgi:malate dehydrogenase
MAERARNGKVTVVGAGFYGSTTALRLAEYDLFDTVVLTDIVEGKPEGLALDMNQSRAIEGFETRVVGVGGGSYEGTEGSDVVVITAGLPRKPGMSRMDLIETNAGIVRQVAENVAQASPDAVLIVVSNPLDEMTALAQLASGFPRHRVMGQAGMLDTARFTNNVAEELGVPVASVRTATRWCRSRPGAPSTASRWPTCSPPTASPTWSTAPATAGPRSWHCSRPGRPTTPPPPLLPAWRAR